MAIVIGVCDDNPQQVGLLIEYINQNPKAAESEIIYSTDPEAFLALFREKAPELVFLDIDMGDTSGILLGEKIRALYEDTVIVYITAHEEYALEAFGVRAFHYLLKPVTRKKFNEVLEESIRKLKASAQKQKKF